MLAQTMTLLTLIQKAEQTQRTKWQVYIFAIAVHSYIHTPPLVHTPIDVFIYNALYMHSFYQQNQIYINKTSKLHASFSSLDISLTLPLVSWLNGTSGRILKFSSWQLSLVVANRMCASINNLQI